MVLTKKFSEFAEADLTLEDNELVGLSNGQNARSAKITEWTTATRPSPPFNGLIGYNTDLDEWEYYNESLATWVQLSNSFGLVNITIGDGLLGTPNPITGTGTIVLDTPVNLTRGGTNASLTASNGGIVWSNATQLQILAGTATARQVLLSGLSTTPAWSTATYPATTTINQILYSSANNVIDEIATLNSGVLVTSAAGVPSISTTLPAGLTIPGYAHSGANSDITSMTGLTGVLQAPTFINDSAGLPILNFGGVPSAVNYVTISNNSAGNPPIVNAVGSDTTVALNLKSKGNIFFFSPNNATGDAELRWFLANGLDYVGLKAPSSITSKTYTLPATIVTNGVLTTSSAGVLSFTDTNAKVLCNKVGNSTTINYSINVSSTTHASTGVHVINFTTAFGSTSYITNANSLIAATLQFCMVQSQATSSVSINTFNSAGTATDPTQLLVSCFGAQ